MSANRELDAMCPTCQDVQVHETRGDPGSCICTVCGNVQALMAPLA